MTADLVFQDLQRPGAELDARARQLAGGLQALGLQAGDVVAAMLCNHPVYADLIQACRVAGTYYCPINWHFKTDEVAYILRDCGPKLLVIEADLLEDLRQAVPPGLPVLLVDADAPDAAGLAVAANPVREYEGWLAEQDEYSGPPVAPRGHMAYTSGTTGRPKGVVREPVPIDQLAAQQASVQRVVAASFGITPGVRALLPAPLYHSAPSLFAQQALLQGALLVLMPRFDPEETLALVERHRIETLYLVPIMYVRLLRLADEVRRRYDLSSLRFVASTGAPCAPEVKKAMIEWLGPIVYETYASSETGMITVIDSCDALRKPGCAGRPVGDAQIRIVDEQGNACPPGQVGLIYARQPAYPDFTYRNNPEARRKIDRDGLVTLGDMGYLDEEGYLFLCDRASDMVISGGVNIYPAEIEHVVNQMPGVADCAVFGVPDPEYGERLVAAIQPQPGAALRQEAVETFLRARLAGYKVPRSVIFDADLPRDDNGKIAKRKLREAYRSGAPRGV